MDKLDKIQDMLYETAKNLEVLSTETARLRKDFDTLAELVKSHHEKLMIMDGKDTANAKFYTFLSRHGWAILAIVSALSVAAYQLKIYGT